MIYLLSINLHFKLKFNVLLLCFNPVYNLKKNIKVFTIINRNFNSQNSVINSPSYCFQVQFVKLVIVIELRRKLTIKFIFDETLIDKLISGSDEIILNESSCLSVETEHKSVGILIVNMHQHIQNAVCVVSQLTKWECTH